MTTPSPREPRVAIVRRELAPREGTPGGATDRLRGLLDAFAGLGVTPDLVTYAEEDAEVVRARLLEADLVLVFVDPIHAANERDRSALDPLLRKVAEAGTVVSTHPDVILAMGTKEVLYTTRELPWGGDTHSYATPDAFRVEFPARLALAGPRVLKRHRGNGGAGVWKVELTDEARAGDSVPGENTLVRVLHGARGSLEEDVRLGEFFARCDAYFEGGAPLIDQAYAARLDEGQVRVYVVVDQVAGFGRQKVAALMPAPADAPPPEAEPRYYFGPDVPDLQRLRRLMDSEWIPELQRVLGIPRERLPLLWDADFLYGPRAEDGSDTFVLCEINVSSVIPFPAEAAEPLARAAIERAGLARR